MKTNGSKESPQPNVLDSLTVALESLVCKNLCHWYFLC